jgi:ammonia channel protein AmtB
MIIGFVLQRVLPGGTRVTPEQELEGLDLNQHSEQGYALDRV